MERVNVLLNMEYTHIVLDYKLTRTSEECTCHTRHIFLKLMGRTKAQKTPPDHSNTVLRGRRRGHHIKSKIISLRSAYMILYSHTFVHIANEAVIAE